MGNLGLRSIKGSSHAKLLYIPEDLYAELQQGAKLDNRSLHAYIIHLLRTGLKNGDEIKRLNKENADLNQKLGKGTTAITSASYDTRRELDRLRKENAQLLQARDHHFDAATRYFDEMANSHAETEALEDKLAKAREALRFYARCDRHDEVEFGKVARQVYKEIIWD